MEWKWAFTRLVQWCCYDVTDLLLELIDLLLWLISSCVGCLELLLFLSHLLLLLLDLCDGSHESNKTCMMMMSLTCSWNWRICSSALALAVWSCSFSVLRCCSSFVLVSNLCCNCTFSLITRSISLTLTLVWRSCCWTCVMVAMDQTSNYPVQLCTAGLCVWSRRFVCVCVCMYVCICGQKNACLRYYYLKISH